jgi:hypothetical protein
MGVVVTASSATKPLVGSEDFLWGFHPLAWDYEDTKAALIWILRERWQLPVLFD